jgi:hypothetical protein
MNEPTQRCVKCGDVKPLSEFWRDAAMPNGVKIRCKGCLSAQKAHRRATQPEAVHAVDDAYRRANPGVLQAAKAKYLATDSGQEKHREDARKYRATNPEKVSELNRQYADEVRGIIFARYGTSCACCSSAEDLTIDHVGGGGTRHRREVFNGRDVGGWAFYRELIRLGLPDGYQALCRPCNLSKRDGSRCKLDHSPAGGRRFPCV